MLCRRFAHKNIKEHHGRIEARDGFDARELGKCAAHFGDTAFVIRAGVFTARDFAAFDDSFERSGS